MADIELVIKIPEELFSEIDDENYQSTISWYDTTLYCAIKDGTPLADMLDMMRAEIEKAVWEDVIVSLDGTDEVRIPRLDPDDVFEIIDKYKAESEKA